MWPKREKSVHWKGGRFLSSHGYYLVKVDESKYTVGKNRYAYEHRYLMEVKLGRKLTKKEIVHHINGNKTDNRIENLLLCSIKKHKFIHRIRDVGRKMPDEKNILISCMCGCGERFLKYDKTNRKRMFISGHNAKLKIGKGKKYTIDIINCECGCGERINRYDKYGRTRRFLRGHVLKRK